MRDWRPIKDAPKMIPVLVALAKSDTRDRDAMHGRILVAANRGMGWISIPGMWRCRPTAWMPLPEPPEAPDADA